MKKGKCIIKGCGKSFIYPPKNPRKLTCCDTCSLKLRYLRASEWRKRNPNYHKNRRLAIKKAKEQRVEEIRLKNMEKRNG